MGCPGKTVKSDLPVITKPAAFTKPKTKVTHEVTATGEARPKLQRTRTIVDFHCPQCGITKPAYPNYWHQCPGPQPVGYQVARQAICNACPHNRDGVCLPLKVRQPDKPCLVEIGIPMPGVECPLKKWRRVLFSCDQCGSVRFDASGLSACPTCRQKPTVRPEGG